jgi:hypothetical protein
MAWPDRLKNPEEMEEGIRPAKVYEAEEDDEQPDRPFIRAIDMGVVNPAAFTGWEAIKGMVREAASQNELRIGQLTGKTHVTATEINKADSGTDALTEQMAADIEEQILSPLLELA